MEELKIIKITKDNSTGNRKLDTCINKINIEFSRGLGGQAGAIPARTSSL